MAQLRWIGVGVFAAAVSLVFVACSSSESSDGQYGSPSGTGGTSGSGGGTGGGLPDGAPPIESGPDSMLSDVMSTGDGPQFDPDAYWADDPPPQTCLDGGPTYPTPGGTPECPDDKNREGCPCTTAGESAACWPGFRKNRNRGICHDGTTTCLTKGENELVWGPCEGYQLPTGTSGAAACVCFSGGQWKISNLSPCFFAMQGEPDGSGGAVSTLWDGSQAQCPPFSGSTMVQPTQPWSPNTLRVDCAGHFKLCYTLKAGNAQTPQAADCVLTTVCTEADYWEPNVEQAFPDLPSWIADTPAQKACSTQFATTGGYGEMSVLGLSVECDEVDDGNGGPRVFNRVQYCPLYCAQNPSAAGCENCQAGGSGSF